ncbi:helix-turn-helix domain-containing protein [Clostridium sp. Cult3]|uniref:helix-turn-helix domain-containing protein n=1 Tax=Clostridium sp. Cult3 TaxID=2079004 RepID=UPI001F38E8A2|nr:helix-turn-helix transcriptional regulator [Clostridium sp. Cult3]MCF6461464.1 hypothetical protein [Clostridium sp. Cult3]
MVGERIRKLRKERNFSLREMAEKSGISSFSYLANIERGIVEDPGIKTIIKIAKGLDVSIDYLVKGE